MTVLLKPQQDEDLKALSARIDRRRSELIRLAVDRLLAEPPS
jgi:hypothetical protein